MYDETTGCRGLLSTPKANVSFPTSGDESHAYWLSYGTSGSITAQPPRLMRIDLRNGALTQIDVEGFDFSLRTTIVGQDEEHVYLSSDAGLTAVRKP